MKELAKWLNDTFEIFLTWIAWALKVVYIYRVSAFSENLNVKMLWLRKNPIFNLLKKSAEIYKIY